MSREAALQISPGREPWDRCRLNPSPGGAAEGPICPPLRGSVPFNENPGLTPWADLLTPLRGSF
jgi:hypothetical protein